MNVSKTVCVAQNVTLGVRFYKDAPNEPRSVQSTNALGQGSGSGSGSG
jgi:hypothetical protein